ncbi:MAG: aminotransferase class V-fold PLP-dependent enzyme [Tissierellia bacterium]|nr:aminotransferase class V-fold PLP-dependent enzyme [Tissierellia bacterium]MDD3225926.1 aminotransferase class V-fold PLP-dependent enzyme [Tissierellia bacterium]MDD3750876.1 aminotransferase class V-fold PLP-dependent enzyme [Tissierellia bacterium]MDD4045853.1 aminotransferase class V-fold PLP-dependent enzyme [Tissierellia bacterium]MDD4678029.1 aminotransferase class V-fold PLP-dependent enzyme [Tissierellia bacterium]
MIYLDNAATTFPKPSSVYKSVMRAMTVYGANPGRGSHAMAIEGARIIYETRELLAELFNLDDPMRVIFTFNATDSLNIAIKGILNSGDHVVTTEMEHNSVLRPIKKLESSGVENTIVRCASDGTINLVDLESAIKDNTKLIVTTHVSNLTGTIFPAEEIGKICKKHNILYLLDASQSAGVLPIDIKKYNISFLAMPGHKGLLGPQGTGALLINSDMQIEKLKEGGTGSQSSSLEHPNFYPDKLEAGTHNLPGIAGLNAGLKYILNRGIESIYSHEKGLLDIFIAEMRKNPKIKIYGPESIEHRIGVVPININGMDSSEVADILDTEYRIAVRPGLHCAPLAHKAIGTEKLGAVRFGVGPFNKITDIMAAVDALNKISG